MRLQCNDREVVAVFETLESRRLLSAVPPVPIPPPNDGNDAEQVQIVPSLTATPSLSVSTVPHNGDVNPYGVAFVPQGFAAGGPLHAGDVLVSNFNNSQNLQGTGTTIVRITPDGHQSVFFQGAQGLGLTTALGVLRRGFVLVGNVPTTDGTSATVKQGSLLILDRNGHEVADLKNHNLLDGPWDLTVQDDGPLAQVFVSNVLSGTVTRIDLAVPSHGSRFRVLDMTQIGSGYLHRSDPAALVVGPTGLAFNARHDVLYVASTGDNAIYSIANAGITLHDHGKGTLVYSDDQHLRGPLGLVQEPNGDLVTTNGDAVNGDSNHPSELVEFTPTGHFVAQRPVNDTAQGGAFGIAIQQVNDVLEFAAVDDVTNFLDVWKINV
jgi:hypothetical protein